MGFVSKTGDSMIRAAWFASALLCPVVGISAEIDFVRDIRPIFQENCYDCHGEDKQKSGLRLDVRELALKGGEFEGPNLIPGKPGESNLIHFVRGDDKEMRMPPKGDLLSPEQIEALTQWVKEGAVWPEDADLVEYEDPRDHWSFFPITDPEPPVTVDSKWPRGAIDQFILARLEKEKLAPNPVADKASWLRRIYFDLTGLPPTPAQVDSFSADDSEAAYATVVDELLASPRYGERWAQHWLDVVRYADTHGFEVNTPRDHAWPYRDYVIDAFNRDLPYDQFIREQLIGDQIGKDAATGFLVSAAVLLPGQIGKDDASKRLARQDELGEMIINVGEAFLGLSIGCARCHDHKFDPISAKDYYSMQAFFAGVKYGDRRIESPEVEAAKAEVITLKKQVRDIESTLADMVPKWNSGATRLAVNAAKNIDRFDVVKTKRVRFTVEATNNLEPCIDELEVFNAEGTNVALAKNGGVASASGSKTSKNRHELRFVNDGEYGNSRSWMSSETGGGWVAIELAKVESIDRIDWGRDREGKFKDRLATKYQIEVWSEEKGWQLVSDSSDRAPFEAGKKAPAFSAKGLPEAEADKANALNRERKQLEARIKELEETGMVYAGIFGEPEKMSLLRRGDPEQPVSEVEPATISFLGAQTLPKTSSDHDRRAMLAEWVVSPENPLTARVVVNRIWQWHFGIGLVDTPNDFGNLGVEPTHPELLDWLATEFVKSGWSVKHLHRLIVLSSTYRQSNRVRPDGLEKDSDVRLLWRYPSRRLEAEAIRDTMLSVSGRLNLETGGPGFNLFKTRGGLSGFPPVESFEKDGLKRMIYAHKIRMERDAVFGAFDCPDAGQSAPRRMQSTTPVQALNLFNSRYTIEESDAFAKRVVTQAGPKLDQQVRLVWDLAYARDPDAAELADAVSVVSEHGLPTLCRAVYNSNEFLFLP